MLRWGIRARSSLDTIPHPRLCRSLTAHLLQAKSSPQTERVEAPRQTGNVVESARDLVVIHSHSQVDQIPLHVDSDESVLHSRGWSLGVNLLADSHGSHSSEAPCVPTVDVDTAAIDTLRRVFSQGGNRPLPRLFTPKELRSLYYSAKSRSQLAQSDSSMLTALIALFGTLSVDFLGNLVYQSPFVSLVRRNAKPRNYWAFVSEVGAFKIRHGMTLNDSDRFWLMRGALAASRNLIGRSHEKSRSLPSFPPMWLSTPSLEHIFTLIRRARNHYHAIRGHSFHPEVHIPYLETLLDTQDMRYIELLAGDVSFVLRTHRSCSPRLVQLLHRLVLQFGTALSRKARNAIISALWMRAQHTRAKFDNWAGLSTSGEPDECRADGILDATNAACRLSATLFQSQNTLADHQHPWPTDELCAIFSPTQDLTQQWMSLTLVALFHAPGAAVGGSLLSNGALEQSQSPATSCWRVIFGLAILEKLLKGLTNSSSERNTILGTFHALYEEWFQIMDSRTISPDIACAITASFFRLAGRVQEASLVRGCLALCDTRRLWGPTKAFEKNPAVDSSIFMTAQYLVALLRLHGPNVGIVTHALGLVSANDQLQSLVFAVAIKQLSGAEPELALALHDIAGHNGKNVGTDHIHTLAVSLARCGVLDRATQFLEDKTVHLSGEQRKVLITAIACRILDDKFVRPPAAVLSSLADALVALYGLNTPANFPRRLRELLILLCRYGEGSKAVDVVASISRAICKSFTMRFLWRLCRALLRHRQFRSAVKLLAVVDSLYPPYSRQSRVSVANAAIRAGALRVAMTLHSQLPPSAKISLWYEVQVNADRSRCKTWRKSASLRLSSALRKLSPDDPAFEDLFRGLLSSGRVLAAKRVFARIAPTVRPARRTVLANVLLHGVARQPFPRNGRRLRKVLSFIEEMIARHGVRSDRVTVNILIKTMLSWRSVFDKTRLRTLFDHLVRGGYPAGDGTSHDLPFGTTPIRIARSLTFEEISTRVDFEKHVRPLYKMFVTAFYARGDVEAARRVIGILKLEERRHEVSKEARQDKGPMDSRSVC